MPTKWKSIRTGCTFVQCNSAMPERWYHQLKELASKETIKTGELTNIADLVRRACRDTYKLGEEE